jgi:cobaltochelatase CobN
MLNTVNNFWGWQVMDRNVVRDDQWQEFHESYVKDRYKLGMRQWFEKSNPTALAQIAERMLEAIRKDYWQADEQTKRELVEVYQEIARKHDVHTSNQTFKAYVAELAAGFGLGQPMGAVPKAAPQATTSAVAPPPKPRPTPPDVVRGQQLKETPMQQRIEQILWAYAWLLAAIVLAGIGYQAWRTRRESLARSRSA